MVFLPVQTPQVPSLVQARAEKLNFAELCGFEPEI